MTIIVGIFDDAADLDRAVRELADQGYDETVFDQSIAAEEVDSAGLLFPLAKHSRPLHPPGEVTDADRYAAVRAFKSHLHDDFHLPEEVITLYATTFFHEGKFLLIKAERDRADAVVTLLRRCNASQVNRHG